MRISNKKISVTIKFKKNKKNILNRIRYGE